MPLYEFQCSECDRSFEELVRTPAAVTEVKCPRCGSVHVRRKVSIFASKSAASAPCRQLVRPAAPGGIRH